MKNNRCILGEILKRIHVMGPNWGTHPYSAMAEYCVPLPAGGYECDFVDPIPESLSCPICLLAFRDPHILDCCGAKYCEPCIGRVKAAGQPCPLCKQQFTSLVDRNDQRRVLNLKVRCSRKKDGCQWAGEVRHLSDHERNECMWALVECQYHCGERAPRHHLIQHQQDECPQRPVDVKLESFMRKMETKLTAEKERHKEEMAAVNEAVKEMEKNYTREMAGMKEDHMKEMATMRDDHMKEMAAIRKEITSATEMVKREMATVRDDHVKEMATMRKDMATLRETEKHITGETATTKKDIMKEMAALKKDYTKEMNNLREKEMAAEKHIRAMVAVKEDHKKELASLREELKKMNQQMAERQQSMDKKLAKHREIEVCVYMHNICTFIFSLLASMCLHDIVSNPS